MEQLQVFKNEQFGEIRTTIRDGEVWFVAKDIAENLGYVNTNDAINKNVDKDDKGVAKCDTLGGKQNLTIINESGFYSLIFASKLPVAKEFRKWVTSEVLPNIRKNGGYVNNADRLVDTYFGALDSTSKGIIKGLFTNIEKQQKTISTLQPKAEGFEQFLDTNNTYSWDVVAKNLGIGKNNMLSILRTNKILQTHKYFDYKGRECSGERHNVPYQAFMKYFDVKFTVKGNKRFAKVLVKAEGQDYLRKKLTKLGYIEKVA